MSEHERDNELSRLLAAAAAADGLHRMDYRDPIAAFGAPAIARLEPWLFDARLASFAVRTIERSAAQPDVRNVALDALHGAAQRASPAVRRDIADALNRLNVGRVRRSPAVAARGQGGTRAIPAPPELAELVSDWRHQGCPVQPPIPWPVDRWLEAFPDHGFLLRALPGLMGRAEVRAACTPAALCAENAVAALLATLAWGFGRIGYAQTRAATMLATPGAADRLQRVAETLREADGAVRGYALLADGGSCRLHGLGPSFATKYLYFCQPDNPPGLRALIHDRVISKWLLETAGLPLASEPYSIPRYRAYLEQMRSWAGELDCRPDELEMIVFRSEQGVRSQWA